MPFQWDPDNDLSKEPLDPRESQQTRRVLKWYERRVVFWASIRVWGAWVLGLPTALLAVYTIVQAFLHHGVGN
jgi:hypothetical protein